jgi:hypothetical protein
MLPEALAQLDRVVDTTPIRAAVRMRLGRLQARLAPDPVDLVLPEGCTKLCFHHIRKTGGTSLILAFFRLAGEDIGPTQKHVTRYTFARRGDYTFVANNVALINEGRFNMGWSHRPSYVARPPLDRTYRVTVLRDPVERVVSLYRYLSDASADESYTLKAPPQERLRTREGYDRFLEQLPQAHLLNQLYTFSERGEVDEAVAELQTLHMILRTEHLQEDSAKLGAVLGRPIHVGQERVSRLRFELSPGQWERTRHMTDPEYQLLDQLIRR